MLMPRVSKINSVDRDQAIYKTVEIAKIDKPQRTSYASFEDEKARHKFIVACERVIRTSMEYQQFVKFLRDEIDMTTCSFLKDINSKEMRNVKIELHHAPFTLYDITAIVINKMIANEERVNHFTVAYEVMMLHYRGVVGIVPLSGTVHKLVHNGYLFIPINYVFGNVYKFYEEYEVFMSEDQKAILEANITATKRYEYNPQVLSEAYVYLDIDGQGNFNVVLARKALQAPNM